MLPTLRRLATAAALLALPAAAHARALTRRDVAFSAGLGALVVLNRVQPYHYGSPDRHDPLIARDKMYHFGGAALGTAAGAAFGARPLVAAVASCGAGVAFEYTQARVSTHDMIADCTGAMVSWGVLRLARSVRGRHFRLHR